MNWLQEVLLHAHHRALALRELGAAFWLDRMRERAPGRAWSRALAAVQDGALIAEIKPASPTMGRVDDPLDAVQRARVYIDHGARAISVLTEPRFFAGHADLLRQVAESIPVPVLRKDFIVDPVQVVEAAACGAAAVLVIHRVLDDAMRQRILRMAHVVGVEVLYEVLDTEEARRALDLGITWIGINNRDLDTLELDPDRALRVFEALDWPAECRVVVESGITAPHDVERYRRAGLRYFLVGSALMRAPDPGALVRDLCRVLQAPGR